MDLIRDWVKESIANNRETNEGFCSKRFVKIITFFCLENDVYRSVRYIATVSDDLDVIYLWIHGKMSRYLTLIPLTMLTTVSFLYSIEILGCGKNCHVVSMC